MALQTFDITACPHPIGPQLLQQIGSLRVDAWQEESGVSAEIAALGSWTDRLDDAAQHWLVHDEDGSLLGAARLTFHDRLASVNYGAQFAPVADRLRPPFASISRLVLRKSVHHRGLWRRLDEIRIAQARASGMSAIVAICGSYRLDKLASHGFRQIGPKFAETELPDHDAYPVCLFLDTH